MPELQLAFSDIYTGPKPKDLRADDGGSLRKLVIHAGNTIELELDTWGRNLGTPKMTANPAGKVTITGPKAKAGKWTFLVKANAAGAGSTVELKAMNAAGSVTTSPVTAFVGQFKETPDFPIDLIANVFKNGKGYQMQALTRMLHNHSENLANQKSKFNVGRWTHDRACGTVAKVAGQRLFNNKTEYEDKKKTGGHIHKPIIKVGKPERKDITYVPGIIETMGKAIKKNLEADLPVVVSAVDSPPDTSLENGMLGHTSFGAHSVLIIGCSSDAKKFLFIDPWPGGSKYKYEGTIHGAATFGIECKHLGVFAIMPAPEADRPFDIMMNHPDTQGSHSGDAYLEVIFGPR